MCGKLIFENSESDFMISNLCLVTDSSQIILLSNIHESYLLSVKDVFYLVKNSLSTKKFHLWNTFIELSVYTSLLVCKLQTIFDIFGIFFCGLLPFLFRMQHKSIVEQFPKEKTPKKCRIYNVI